MHSILWITSSLMLKATKLNSNSFTYTVYYRKGEKYSFFAFFYFCTMMDDLNPFERKWLSKMAKYCSMQERAELDVNIKLTKLGANSESVNKIISWLKENNYLNQSRFNALFIRSKVNQNRWGRIKLSYELKKKGVTNTAELDEALQGIDEVVYNENLRYLLAAKYAELKRKEATDIKPRLFRFAQGKGYTANEIFTILDEILN
jgi:regulatory protein